MNIGFIGLGKLGLPVAEVMAERYKVYGYDINKIESNKIILSNTLDDLIANTDLIFIAVQTPHEAGYGGEIPNAHLPKKDFDYTHIETILGNLSPMVTDNHTIVLISTVLPGTIRKRLICKLKKGKLIYNPYLIAMGTVKEDFRNPEMIIIGTENGDKDDINIKKLQEIYNHFTPNNCRYEIGTWEEAESIKIFYNTFISAKIAVVNMIQDVAENIGYLNVDVVTNALASSNKRITSSAYMKAGMGDGGPCHPRDNIAMSWLAENIGLDYDIFHAISYSREQQAKKIAMKLSSFGNPIVILGSNYKPNTQLKDGSFALLVNSFLQLLDKKIFIDENPIEEGIYTYLLCHEHTYLDFPFHADSLIFDPWRSFKTDRTDLSIYYYGNSRK